jgi:ParB-like chromosome segregation protein Spo0J
MEPTLQIRRVALDALHQDPANARAHGPENMAAIEASLARFGQAEPLVVHAGTGRVIGGNGRLAAMPKYATLDGPTFDQVKEAHHGRTA